MKYSVFKREGKKH